MLKQPKRGERIFPHNPLYLSEKFHEAAKAAGVEDAVLHDLRHEGISRMFELGFQIQEVAMVSGHTNWKTLKRYTHLRPSDLIERERMLRLLMKKTGGSTRSRKETPARAPQDAKTVACTPDQAATAQAL